MSVTQPPARLIRLGYIAASTGPPLFGSVLLARTVIEYDFMRSQGWEPLGIINTDWPSGLALGPFGCVVLPPVGFALQLDAIVRARAIKASFFSGQGLNPLFNVVQPLFQRIHLRRPGLQRLNFLVLFLRLGF